VFFEENYEEEIASGKKSSKIQTTFFTI